MEFVRQVSHADLRVRDRLDPEHLRPLHDWLEKYEQSWNERLDRMDVYLSDLLRKE